MIFIALRKKKKNATLYDLRRSVRKKIHSSKFIAIVIMCHTLPVKSQSIGLFYGFLFPIHKRNPQRSMMEWRKKERDENKTKSTRRWEEEKKITNLQYIASSVSHHSIFLIYILFIPVHSPLAFDYMIFFFFFFLSLIELIVAHNHHQTRINWDYWLIVCVVYSVVIFFFLFPFFPLFFFFQCKWNGERVNKNECKMLQWQSVHFTLVWCQCVYQLQQHEKLIVEISIKWHLMSSIATSASDKQMKPTTTKIISLH